ncbi:MAG: hypothetical protein ACRC53_10280 [Plesiomonas sp.]|uniref:hypothetical protein n=1 Tax=Plesiomonas sp. TaxID=2486279 RepID=UPI003F3885E3
MSEHTALNAEVEAKKLNEQWRIEAEAVNLVKKETRVVQPDQNKKNIIANNFRAMIEYAPPRRGRSAECSPQFVIAYKNSDGRYTRRTIRIRTYGLTVAFKIAVEFYAEVYGLSREERNKLLTQEVSRDVFTDYLYPRFIARYGRDVLTLTELNALI